MISEEASDNLDGAESSLIPVPQTKRILESLPASKPSKKYRVLDVVLSFIALVLLSPLMLLIAGAVCSTSRGSALFRQKRVGYLGETFELLKFRTMRANNDDSIHRTYVTNLLIGDGPSDQELPRIYKLEHDPRVTPVGKILRRLSLDELPQLINVLRGDMSLVGPRPALSWEVELFKPIYASRFLVRPGMTGLWQVSGRNKVSITHGLDLDLQYVGSQSVRLYIWILVRTIPTILLGSGAR
jgi:lipopolysaccharide/colanic/teichoic acid biosynthesis glycosyltransferase